MGARTLDLRLFVECTTTVPPPPEVEGGYLLFQNQNDLVSVLEDVLEVNDPVGVGAGRQHGDLVQYLHRAVDAAADARRELGRVHDARLPVRALAYGGEKTAGKKRE